MTKGKAIALGFVVAAALAAQGAFGQGSGGASLKGHDSNAPIDVGADRIEVQDRADRAFFTGNVQVQQAEMHLSSDRLTVAYANQPAAAAGQANAGGAGGVLIKRLDASGNVVITRPGEIARSQFAIYDVDRKLVTLLGNVSLVRGDSRVNGGRLVLELDTGRAVMDGGAAGAPGSRTSGGRVSGRFTVPRTQQGQQSRAPARPAAATPAGH